MCKFLDLLVVYFADLEIVITSFFLPQEKLKSTSKYPMHVVFLTGDWIIFSECIFDVKIIMLLLYLQ